MAASPVLYVYYRPDNDDAYPGVPNRHITEADWASFTIAQRRTIENATTQEGYTRRKVWVHRDLVDETEQERAEREAAEQAARDAFDRSNSTVKYRDIAPLMPGAGSTTFNADGSITSTAGVPSITTFNADGSITTVYGAPVNKTIRTTFNPDGTITEAQV